MEDPLRNEMVSIQRMQLLLYSDRLQGKDRRKSQQTGDEEILWETQCQLKDGCSLSVCCV